MQAVIQMAIDVSRYNSGNGSLVARLTTNLKAGGSSPVPVLTNVQRRVTIIAIFL